MRVVIFGTYNAAVHPRAAVLIDGLADQGFDVVEVNAPLDLGTADRVAMLQQPWRLAGLVTRLAGCWARLLGASRSVRTPDAVLVPYLGHFDVLLARLRWPRRVIVLDFLVSAAGTAKDRGETGGLKLGLLRLLDTLATRAADVVVVDTDESATLLSAHARARAVVVPVGATDAWFEAADDRVPSAGGGPLSVVFFGSFSPLQGTTTIARALTRIDEGSLAVTLLGTGQDHDEVRRLLVGRRDVTWHDWVPIEDLPALVASHDVCLGIFGDTNKALTVVPTKIYQGAAAGCALVTSATAPHRRILDGAAVLVPPADDGALADALVILSRDPAQVARLRRAAADRAADFTPMRCLQPLAVMLRSSPGNSSSRHLGMTAGMGPPT